MGVKSEIHDDGCRYMPPELALLRLRYYHAEITFEGGRISMIRYGHRKFLLVIDFRGGVQKTRSCREHIRWFEGFDLVFRRISNRGSRQ